MKNSLTKVATRLERASDGEGNKADLATIAGAILRLVRFVSSRPAWVRRLYADYKDMSIYHVTIGKQKPIKVLLAKTTAESVIHDRAEHQGAVQYVWLQARYEVELDPVTYAGIRVPALHVWRNLDQDGKYVVRVEWHRNATASERKLSGSTNPLREFVSGYIDYVAPSG